ncbi:hypothetical protein AB1N83_013782 [Pleurotus pulmonarius]
MSVPRRPRNTARLLECGQWWPAHCRWRAQATTTTLLTEGGIQGNEITNDKGRGAGGGTSPSKPVSARRTALTPHGHQYCQRKPPSDATFRVCPPVASRS